MFSGVDRRPLDAPTALQNRSNGVNRLRVWIVLTVIASRITVSHQLAVLQQFPPFLRVTPHVPPRRSARTSSQHAYNAGVFQTSEVWGNFQGRSIALLSLGGKKRPKFVQILELSRCRESPAERHQACFIAPANFCAGSVLSTSSFVNHARRACRTPKRIFSRCEV
jgi:hypothetical protein